MPTDDEVAQMSDRWRPYRSLAMSYLFASEYDANRDRIDGIIALSDQGASNDDRTHRALTD